MIKMWDREKVKREFAAYTANYDIKDPKIALKVGHTYMVAQLCEQIAKSIGLNDEDILIAWTCGMLHDIGRFEQVKRFGTFFDSLSVDHATFGADLLFKEGLFERFISQNDIDVTNVELIEQTIRVHSLFRIPEMGERETMFANILRDADKIDILRVNTQTRPEDVYNVSTQELRTSSVSEEVKKAFDEGHCAKRSDRTSAIDYLVGHVCLVYELVYPISRQIAFEQGYLYKLLEFVSDNPDTNAWFAHMKEAMQELRAR